MLPGSLKSVLQPENLNTLGVLTRCDPYYIETAWVTREAGMLHEKVAGTQDNPLLFLFRDCFDGAAVGIALSQLHFDEYQSLAIHGDKINFPLATLVVAYHWLQTMTVEMSGGDFFAPAAGGAAQSMWNFHRLFRERSQWGD